MLKAFISVVTMTVMLSCSCEDFRLAQIDLDSNRKLWRSQNIDHYSFEAADLSNYFTHVG